jgi:hypothetical protein
MAYLPQVQTEEDKKREEQMRAASGLPGSGAPAGDMPAGAQPSPTSGASGNFTNLQRYLTENKSQASDLAGKVGATVTAAGEEAKKAAEGVATAGKSQIEAARVQPTGIVDEAATNPTGVASDAAKLAAFKRERDASYGGPSGLEDVEGFQDAQDKVKKAQERIGLTGTEEGRTTLLSDMGGPGYGRGKATLNQLLLSGDPDAAQTLSAAADPYKGLQDYLGAQSDEARTAAARAVEEASVTKKAVQDRFTGAGGVIPSFGADLTQRVDSARSGASDKWSAIASKLDAGTPLTAEELSLAGLTANEMELLYRPEKILRGIYGNPLPASSFLQKTASPEMITRENLATADDYAQAAALAELMGQSPDLLSNATVDQAGTAVTDLGDILQETVQGQYKGINFPTTKQPIADADAKLHELDNQTGQALRGLAVGIANGGTPQPLSPQDRERFQNVIDRFTFKNQATGQASSFGTGNVGLNLDDMRLLRKAYGFNFPGLDAAPVAPPPPPQDQPPMLPMYTGTGRR